MSKILYWNGMTGRAEPCRKPSSMHLVDYYNVKAFRDLGWEVRMGFSYDHPCIGFFHQSYSKVGKPSFHYSCTSSTATIPTPAVSAAQSHAAVFVLNNLMLKNYRTLGVNAYMWPHGIDAEECAKLDESTKFDEFTILNVAQGQFDPYHSIKGISQLVDAVLEVDNVRLMQIGCFWDEDTKIPTRHGPIKIKDMKPKIQFLGEVPHASTLQIMARSHIVMSCSHGEGMPLPSLEAIGLGIPILSTDLPYTHDWPVNDVIRRIPTDTFINISLLHDQPFSPRDLKLYSIPPTLFKAKEDPAVHLLKAIADYPDWSEQCRLYKDYAREHASWLAIARDKVLPIIEEHVNK